MDLAIRAVAQSHAGLVRAGNEDSGYAGPRLLAVADGMGGHAAGEVASAVAVESLAALDGPGPAPEDLDTSQALTTAITSANHRIRQLVDADPRRSGMGTTVTALLWTGGGFSLAHIGDSRAYLLRGGELVQLTRDHTYVQALIDEGRIDEDERETHPARSLLLQALGGEDIVPDLADVVAEDGDRVLLCSDGLSGVVSADAIARVLLERADPQEAADELVAMAVAAGGPDNITCVVADVRTTSHTPGDDDTTEAHLVGAAAVGAAHPDALRYDDTGDGAGDDTRDDTRDDTGEDVGHGTGDGAGDGTADARGRTGRGAEAAAGVTDEEDVDPDEAERYAPRARGRTRLAVGVILAVALLALAGFGVNLLSSWYDQQYFVARDDEDVVIRQGVPGIPWSAVVAVVPDLPVAALPEVYQESLADGIRADDITDAEAIAERVRREACRANNAGPQISGYPGLDCAGLDGSRP